MRLSTLEVPLELAGYFGMMRRWWVALLAAVAVASLGGYLVASRLPSVYEAEVRVLVGPLNTDLDTQRAAGQLTNTYAQLVTSGRITGAVIQRLAVDMSAADLENAITAIPNDVTRLIIIRVQDGDPEQAADLANAVANELGTLAAESDRPEGQTQVIDAATAPTTRIAPQVLLIVLLAAFAGLLASIAIVVVIEHTRAVTGSSAVLPPRDSAPSEDELRGVRSRVGRSPRRAVVHERQATSER